MILRRHHDCAGSSVGYSEEHADHQDANDVLRDNGILRSHPQVDERAAAEEQSGADRHSEGQGSLGSTQQHGSQLLGFPGGLQVAGHGHKRG